MSDLKTEITRVAMDFYDKGRADAMDGLSYAIGVAWTDPDMRLNREEVLCLLHKVTNHIIEHPLA